MNNIESIIKNIKQGTWLIADTGKGDPAWNMALDEALLLRAVDNKQPVVRFYGWKEPAATFGYFQAYRDIEKWTLLRPLIRRPTGGGLVPHLADWTYSAAFPPGHFWYEMTARESYRQLHDWCRLAFLKLGMETSLAPVKQVDIPGQCFIGAEQYDLLWHGKKIAGAAQRRNRHGLLIQGSIQPPPPGIARADWQKAMQQVALESFKADTEMWKPDAATMQLAEDLVQAKYQKPGYNQKR